MKKRTTSEVACWCFFLTTFPVNNEINKQNVEDVYLVWNVSSGGGRWLGEGGAKFKGDCGKGRTRFAFRRRALFSVVRRFSVWFNCTMA